MWGGCSLCWLGASGAGPPAPAAIALAKCIEKRRMSARWRWHLAEHNRHHHHGIPMHAPVFTCSARARRPPTQMLLMLMMMMVISVAIFFAEKNETKLNYSNVDIRRARTHTHGPIGPSHLRCWPRRPRAGLFRRASSPAHLGLARQLISWPGRSGGASWHNRPPMEQVARAAYRLQAGVCVCLAVRAPGLLVKRVVTLV